MTEHDDTLRPLGSEQMMALEDATSRYEEALTFDLEAQEYLEARGIDSHLAGTFRAGDGGGIDNYRLGVVTDPAPGHPRFGKWLSIPYLDAKGRPLQIRFRCIADHGNGIGAAPHEGHGKYMGVTGDHTRLFNVGAVLRARDEIHVTEGEFDAMILNKAGLPAVACPGVNNYKPHYSRIFAGFSRVYVWGDNDDAGNAYMAELTRKILRSRGVQVPRGDITEHYLEHGAESLRSLIERGSK